jgi:hypothetical protein
MSPQPHFDIRAGRGSVDLCLARIRMSAAHGENANEAHLMALASWFLDPDTGIGEDSEKHATYSEIRQVHKPERAIVVITFSGRSMKHVALLRQLHERLAHETHAENIVTLRTNVSVPRAVGPSAYVQRQRWFTVVDPDAELTTRAQAFTDDLASIPRVTAQLD